MKTGLVGRILLLIFFLSGFSGLIYESIWSHYLKIFLGHAAYAQALVLIIFMGGMALGAWFVSRLSHRIQYPLLAYAIIEGGIGLFGLIFHEVFVFVNTISYEVIIPGLDSGLLANSYKILVAAVLILPQSILLGTTFPLMCSGFLRLKTESPGKSISILYFANSIGAAIALLVITFFLISSVGLPGSIFSAGLLNIAIAITTYFLARKKPQKPFDTDKKPIGLGWPYIFLVASFCTGLASFIYEIAWIRMLSMVMGSSTHSFEIMLSAFITGLALGGYWIRTRIDNIKSPVTYVGVVQVVMGLFAFATVFLYGYSFEIMSFVYQALDINEQGYTLFNITNHGIALFIMLPATICAGMTLPLFTYILLRENHQEKNIGLVYSSNTFGAITGILFTIFIGMPLLGLKNTVLLGAMIDILIGFLLVSKSLSKQSFKIAKPVFATIIFTILCANIFFQFDLSKMASGVFRHGHYRWESGTDVIYHKDGKTASISVVAHNEDTKLISTNGKPDASITMNPDLPPTLDEITMKLISAIPMSIHNNPQYAANIGMGSGLTVHTALYSQKIKRIDSIEIESAMVEGARHFIPETINTFDDPRSKIHIEDARTFLSLSKEKYDLIFSEPSNPWVSGVSSLFTQEFYQVTKDNLADGGMFVQWIHTYEFDISLLISILKSLSSVYQYYSIYFTDKDNIILIASLDKPVQLPSPAIFENEELASSLSEIDILNIEDILFRFLGDQTLYNPYISSYQVPANSDFYPILDLHAPKYRFLKTNIDDLLNIRLNAVPILDFIYDKENQAFKNLSYTDNTINSMSFGNRANHVYSMVMTGQNIDDSSYYSAIKHLLNIADSCDVEHDKSLWLDSFFSVLTTTIAYLSLAEINETKDRITPDCAFPVLAEYENDWLGLYHSLGSRNPDTTIEIASRLLTTDTNLDLFHKRFLHTAKLVSLIKLGDYQNAKDMWNYEVMMIFAENNELPLEIKLLLGMVESKLDQN